MREEEVEEEMVFLRSPFPLQEMCSKGFQSSPSISHPHTSLTSTLTVMTHQRRGGLLPGP